MSVLPSGRSNVETWDLTIPSSTWERLSKHLFPGDGDEHGAVIQCGISRRGTHLRLLAREVVLAQDGVDYVPGRFGYRMLTAAFVTKQIIRCRNEQLAYLAVHNHGGDFSVGFSPDDLNSHKRGYPALLDIVRGQPVGALVFASGAVAGSLWLTPNQQLRLDLAQIVGSSTRKLYSAPPPRSPGRPLEYDRQARLFGDRGQDILAGLKVGIIGAGGVGSLLVEYLARLGIRNLVVADPERIDLTNVPRIPGSTRRDARAFLTRDGRPKWLQDLGRRVSTPKVAIMRRLIRRANPSATPDLMMRDFVDDDVARRFSSCDYLFLAADSMQARLVFNALVHGYLIPGVQIGAKVPVDSITGNVGDPYTVVRPVTPSQGCLLCNGLIPPRLLQQEAETPAERRSQRYVDDAGITAPSVISLNAVGASHAVDDFLFTVTGLSEPSARTEYFRAMPRKRRVVFEKPRRDAGCLHCGTGSRSLLARGDAASLPTRERPSRPGQLATLLRTLRTRAAPLTISDRIDSAADE